MKILYTPPQTEIFVLRIEGSLCVNPSQTIPGAGGEKRDGWDHGDEYED